MSEHTFIVYGGYQNPYLRLVRVADGQVWDVAAGQLAESPAWANTAIQLGTKDVVVNGWPVDLPATLPNGAYDVQLYDSGTPSQSDAMVAGWRLIMPHRLLVNPTEFPLDIFGRIRTALA